jgi:hypothetical protein
MALAWAQPAGAQGTPPNCEDDVNVGPNRVYIQAADTQVPILKVLGKQLRAQATPVTIIYTPNGSCSNMTYVFNAAFTPNATAGGTFFIPSDPAFDPKTSTVPNCTPAAGQKPDLGITIVFPDAKDCPMAPAKPATVGITPGPVQAMVFAVPGGVGTNMGSTQTTITAEEAYLVMGLGADKAMVPPWSDPSFIFGRPASKGTQISIGANIGVASAKWKLVMDTMHMIDQSSMVATAIANAGTAGNGEKTLGILGAEIYDPQRAMIHSLAFRAYGQIHSYWPDKTPTSTDKQNVRDGHYPIWSYVQYLYPYDVTNTKAANANAQLIVDILAGNDVSASLNPVFEPLDDVINAGLVPQCAMKVARAAEGGPEMAATVAQPCGCYFDSKKATTSCTTCSTANPCATGTCRHGYCEAK